MGVQLAHPRRSQGRMWACHHRTRQTLCQVRQHRRSPTESGTRTVQTLQLTRGLRIEETSDLMQPPRPPTSATHSPTGAHVRSRPSAPNTQKHPGCTRPPPRIPPPPPLRRSLTLRTQVRLIMICGVRVVLRRLIRVPPATCRWQGGRTGRRPHHARRACRGCDGQVA